eukprot:2422591-Rhodomonas_salina.1
MREAGLTPARVANQIRETALAVQTGRGSRVLAFDFAGFGCRLLRAPSWFVMLGLRTGARFPPRNQTQAPAVLVQGVPQTRSIAFDFGASLTWSAGRNAKRGWLPRVENLRLFPANSNANSAAFQQNCTRTSVFSLLDVGDDFSLSMVRRVNSNENKQYYLCKICGGSGFSCIVVVGAPGKARE